MTKEMYKFGITLLFLCGTLNLLLLFTETANIVNLLIGVSNYGVILMWYLMFHKRLFKKDSLTVNGLRRLNNDYRRRCSTQGPNYISYGPRWFNQLYAFLNSYFWLPCHLCDTKFGGHEWMCSDGGQGICPKCSLKQYNETGNFN
jgi:hypothetical protein